MKTLSREELRKAFNEVVERYGRPTSGDIYCFEQLVSKVARDLGGYNETHIVFENGRFVVSPSVWITAEYAPDHTVLGWVKASEWYTAEQLKALHEMYFGYMF